MYQIARIIFTPQNSENALDTIDHLLHILAQNGQIIGQWIVEKQGNAYHATVILSDENALEEQYHNLHFKDISKDMDISVQIIREDPFASDSCHCKEPEFLVLAFDPDAVSSPVYCSGCGKEIPLIHVSHILGEKEHLPILEWQKNRHAVHQLWLSSVSDRFSKNQILNPDSVLNREGLRICKELEKECHRPVYLLLGDKNFGISPYTEKSVEVCLKCGGTLREVGQGLVTNVCDHCSIAYKT